MAGMVADNQKIENSSSSSDSENDLLNNGNYFINIFVLNIIIDIHKIFF